ncbi:hypothetical protein WA577_001160, partial [Blastocystis sp. JDR]
LGRLWEILGECCASNTVTRATSLFWTDQRMVARFAVLLLLLLFATSIAGKPDRWTEERLDRYYDDMRENCLSVNCKDLGRYENMNCIHECISKQCYAFLYKEEPLEPGEIDNVREDKFITCVKNEIVKGFL